MARAAHGGVQGLAAAINSDAPTSAADLGRRGGLPRVTQIAVPLPAAPLRRFDDRAVEYVPLTTAQAVDTRIKAIAFYLPQFHPIPENDAWWGKGFTEWHNVARGQAQFPGHYQPHLPGELGFYDLRLVDVQRRQIELAKAYGLHGFCYHHYWFGGKRLLRRPLDQLLANPDLDFPVLPVLGERELDAALGWAGQRSPHRAAALSGRRPRVHPRHRARRSRDDRYIRVDGRPLLIVYRPGLLPDAQRDRRALAGTTAGAPASPTCSSYPPRRSIASNPRDFGFDAAVEFAPNNMGAPRITAEVAGVNADFRRRDLRLFLSGRAQPRLRAAVGLPAVPQRRAHVGQRGAASGPRDRLRRFDAGALPGVARERLPLHGRVARPRQAVRLHQRVERVGGGRASRTRPALMATPTCRRPPMRFGKFPVDRRPSIVVVSHDAYFHGAQRLALALTRRSRSRWDTTWRCCSAATGRSRREFAQVGRVHDFSAPASTLEARERIARELFNRGARMALCNTSVVGGTVELLKRGRIQSRLDDSRAARAHRSVRPRDVHRLDRAACRSGRVPGPRRARPFHRADRDAARKGRRAATGPAGAQPLRGRTRDGEAASSGRGWDWLRTRGSFWQSASPTGARASTSSWTSASSPRAAARYLLRVGRPPRRRGLLGGARARRPRRARRAVLVPGTGRGPRRVLCRRRRLPDDVAGGSVPARRSGRPRRTSARHRVRWRRRLRRAPASGTAACWCPISTRRRWQTPSTGSSRIPAEGDRLSEAGKAIIAREFSFIDYARDLVQLGAGPASVGRSCRTSTTRATCGPPAFHRDPDLPAARDHLSRRLLV